MNKHIELAKRWLAGEEVSAEALQANAAAAYAAAYDARAADYWIKRYEELTNGKEI